MSNTHDARDTSSSSKKSSPRSSQSDDASPTVPLDQQGGLLHGNTVIEAGGSDEDGEFSATSIDFDSDADSSLSVGDGDSGRGESISLRSSLYEHSYANGRHPIPNDEAEQSREDMLHAMMLEATDGRLFYAPLGDNPQRIIDLGTGTGAWAMESTYDHDDGGRQCPPPPGGR